MIGMHTCRLAKHVCKTSAWAGLRYHNVLQQRVILQLQFVRMTNPLIKQQTLLSDEVMCPKGFIQQY